MSKSYGMYDLSERYQDLNLLNLESLNFLIESPHRSLQKSTKYSIFKIFLCIKNYEKIVMRCISKSELFVSKISFVVILYTRTMVEIETMQSPSSFAIVKRIIVTRWKSVGIGSHSGATCQSRAHLRVHGATYRYLSRINDNDTKPR